MTEGSIRTEVLDERVAVITIDRPEKRNALTTGMVASLTQAFQVYDTDPEIRCIVLTGAGDNAFCAGHDIKAITPTDRGHLYEEAHMQVFFAPRDTSKPVIAAINGSAYAGGFCLALNCDLRIATPEASFAIPAARLGIVPIAGQSARLPHLLPSAIVTEMVMLGKPLTSQRAEHFGFLNAIVPQADLLDHAVEMAREISTLSAVTTRSYKRIMQTTLFENVPAADAMEYWLAMAAGQGPDLAEGLAAFAERRPPAFGPALR
ncbi:MAG: enoyl-CoA hydratase/isomerase family protein [Proteobacteria bacterium]|nr:enoyl-CoA hydratase/isomerase family protein [Pseudomonadota bacterium]